MEHYFCNGKKGICDSVDCNDGCPYYDGTGGSTVDSAVAAIVRKQENPYWERICKLSERQREKGMKTYGQGLENNPAGIRKRIEHLQEELLDGLMYCEWIKDKLAEWEGEQIEEKEKVTEPRNS